MGWLGRHLLRGGRHDVRDRRAQLREYVARGDRLVAFLTAQDDPSTAQLRERIDEAHRLLERRWTRDDLRALAVPVSAPWPSSRGRDAGAAAPAYADEGDRLIADLNDIASALRAVAEV